MVNNEDFGRRIQKIMDYYALSASGFADIMGVGRSSISHILSGRNKPSLDFVMKIIEAYPDVELHWLLYGKGTFPVSEKKTESISNTPVISTDTFPPVKDLDQDLFSSSSTESFNQPPKPTPPTSNNIQEFSEPVNKQEIERVLIFYTDGTFDQYITKKS